MNRINILDAALCDKIAAGEVVERPASCIKELVENSIDAKATKIEIFVVDGGRTLIEVRDNGIGMSKEDAILSIKRHATSKIHFDQDLFAIKTMGFRGEALSAISAVSRFTLMSKEADCDVGTKLYCINSEVVRIENCAMPNGTTIRVEELFYNTPARLKYLKSENTELSSITDIVYKLALANPNVAISLFINQKLTFKTSGKNDVIEILSSIYGLQIAKNMIPISIKNYDFEIHGFTSNISISRSNKYGISCFINQRYIRNKFLSDSILDGYHEFLFENRYPYTILYIQTDATLLDVNVHPTKQEIRISKENDLKVLIKEGIQNALKKHEQVVENKIQKSPQETDKNLQTYFDFSSLKKNNQAIGKNDHEVLNEQENIYQNVIQTEEKKTIHKDYEIIGQIHGTYILAQSKDGFIIVDQHAAQERVRYEKLKKLFKEPAHVEELLIPLVLEFPLNEFQILIEHLDLLKELKIQAEPFGKNALKITQIPYYFKRVDMKIYVEEVLNHILTNKKDSLQELTDYAIATAACKASLKANMHLSLMDMEAIIHELFTCEDPYTCPHGRPTMIRYTIYELEKFFKRVV